MADIVVYTKPGCPYCSRALELLEKKHTNPKVIVASQDPVIKAEMVARANGRATFPQIFIDGQHVGGCDDLYALDRAGKLDPLLA